MSKKHDVALQVAAYGNWLPHDRVQLDCSAGGPSMTRQEFAEECDVNALMARYEKTAVWPGPLRTTEPVYMDTTIVPNFREALDMLREANEAFMRLPAATRREFDNNAEKFVEFAQDPENRAKLVEWGLTEPEKVPEPPMRVEVVETAPRPGDDKKPA